MNQDVLNSYCFNVTPDFKVKETVRDRCVFTSTKKLILGLYCVESSLTLYRIVYVSVLTCLLVKKIIDRYFQTGKFILFKKCYYGVNTGTFIKFFVA